MLIDHLSVLNGLFSWSYDHVDHGIHPLIHVHHDPALALPGGFFGATATLEGEGGVLVMLVAVVPEDTALEGVTDRLVELGVGIFVTPGTIEYFEWA